MAVKQLHFDGMEKKETLQKFVKFEKEGDFVKGFFIGVKDVPSKKYKVDQTAWIVEIEDSNIAGVKLGDKVLISEKTTMESMRLELSEGSNFALVYTGEKTSKDGKTKFKGFDFYM